MVPQNERYLIFLLTVLFLKSYLYRIPGKRGAVLDL